MKLKNNCSKVISYMCILTSTLAIILSSYLFYQARQNLKNSPAPFSSTQRLAPYEHDYANASYQYGAFQYPKGTLVVIGWHPIVKMPPGEANALAIRHQLFDKYSTPHLPKHTSILLYEGKLYISPIKLEFYPLILAFLLLIFPFIKHIAASNKPKTKIGSISAW